MSDFEQWGFSTTARSTGITTTATTTAAVLDLVPPQPVTKSFDITVDLPEGHLRAIGRVMVRWTVQEWLLQRVLFSLITADERIARLSIATPRASSIVDKIEQICQTRNRSLKTEMTRLKTELTRLEKLRDQVGHGVWTRDDHGRYCAIVYAGNWEAGDLQGTPKRVTPHAKPIDETYLEKAVEDIQASIEVTKALAVEVRAAPGT